MTAAEVEACFREHGGVLWLAGWTKHRSRRRGDPLHDVREVAMRYPHVYRALKALGFSPAKALELIWDARRGSGYAMQFIRLARRP